MSTQELIAEIDVALSQVDSRYLPWRRADVMSVVDALL
jgi:hypothetical protein